MHGGFDYRQRRCAAAKGETDILVFGCVTNKGLENSTVTVFLLQQGEFTGNKQYAIPARAIQKTLRFSHGHPTMLAPQPGKIQNHIWYAYTDRRRAYKHTAAHTKPRYPMAISPAEQRKVVQVQRRSRVEGSPHASAVWPPLHF